MNTETMKTCNKCKTDKPFDAFGKSKRPKDGLYHHCKPCVKSYNAKYHAENPEKHKVRTAKYRAENPEKERAKKAKWHSEHPAMRKAGIARYRATKLQQSPSWACDAAIQSVYSYAQLIQNLTGVKIHVDHIVPLQGETARGLHVADNLQILPAVLNLSKSNKFEVMA